MQRFLLFIGMLALMLGFVATPASAKSQTLVVDDDLGLPGACAGARFSTIQDALKQAKSGTTINVCTGTYTGGLDITKNGISLVATPAGSAHIVGGSVNGLDNIRVLGDDVRVEGFDIFLSNVAISVRDAANVKILNNTLHDNSIIGLAILKSKNVTARGNTLLRNGNGSVNTGGLLMEFSSGVLVEKNAIKNNKSVGILLFGTKDSRITKNTVDNNQRIGIELCNGSKQNRVETNEVAANGGSGILVDDSGSGTFCHSDDAPSTNNTFKQNVALENAKLDARDASTGTKTAGTANTWTENFCGSSDPLGLCPVRR